MGRAAPSKILLVVVAVLTICFAGPLLFVLYRNVRLGADFGEIFSSSRTWGPFGRSLLLGTSVALLSSIVGTSLAWVTIRTDVPGVRLWRLLAPLPLVFPSFVGATALISGFANGGVLEQLIDPLGIDLPELAGFWAAAMVLTLFTYPYVFLPVAARLRRMPASLEESARLLGRSPMSVFLSVVVPQLRTSITAGASLVFLYAISDFGAVQLLRYDTLTRVIYSNAFADQALVMALSLLLAVVALVVVWFEGRQLSQQLVFADSAQRVALPVRLRLSRIPVLAGLVAFFSFALVGPVVSLAYWVLRGVRADRTSGSLVISTDGLASAIGNTVFVSVVAAVLTVLVVLPFAYFSARHPGRPSRLASSVVISGFAMPGLVLAISFVFWIVNSDALFRFYQTLPLLIVAYILHFGAQAARTSEVAVGALPKGVEDAARVLGAGRTRRFFTIELPIIMPGLLAAMGLVLLSTMKELPATLFLRPNGFDTLATRIWASMDNISLAKAGFESLILLVVSAILTWVLVLRHSEAAG